MYERRWSKEKLKGSRESQGKLVREMRENNGIYAPRKHERIGKIYAFQ
jgi:hypothetical protein